MNLLGLRLFAAAPLLLVAAPSTASTALPVRLGPTVMAHPMASRSIGLGKVLTTADGGQIFGFDINQVGRDGVLATAQTVGPSDYLVSMETFDQDDGSMNREAATSVARSGLFSAPPRPGFARVAKPYPVKSFKQPPVRLLSHGQRMIARHAMIVALHELDE